MAFLCTLVSEEERANQRTTQWLVLARYRAANAQRRKMRRLVLGDEMLDAIAPSDVIECLTGSRKPIEVHRGLGGKNTPKLL